MGALACNLAPTVGFIVGSLSGCPAPTRPTVRFRREVYVGSITTVGLDIGVNGGGRMLWAVFAPTSGFPHGALAGSYVGASADVAVGLGLWRQRLGRRIASLLRAAAGLSEANTGINIAAGVSELRLHWAR